MGTYAALPREHTTASSDRGRPLRPRVVVEATSALPAQPARGHHVLELDRGPEPLAVRGVEAGERVEVGVEPVEVTELERSHRVVEGELDGLVDVLGRGQPLLEHVQRL